MMLALLGLVGCRETGVAQPPSASQGRAPPTTADTGCSDPRDAGTPSERGCTVGTIETACETRWADWGLSSPSCPTLEAFVTEVGWVSGGDGYRVVRCGIREPFDVVMTPYHWEVPPIDYWYFDPTTGEMVAFLTHPCWDCGHWGSFYPCWDELRPCGEGMADGREWFGTPVRADCVQQILHTYSPSEFPGYVEPPFHPPWFDTGAISSGGCAGCDHGRGSPGSFAGLAAGLAAGCAARARRKPATNASSTQSAGRAQRSPRGGPPASSSPSSAAAAASSALSA